jgi:tetratricopeptide (TPR) repeat protein
MPIALRLLRPAAVALSFVAALAVFLALGRSSAPPATSSSSPSLGIPVTARTTDARIRILQADVRLAPRDPRGYARLGSAYLQKVRETGDPGFYARAATVVDRALRLGPRSTEALTVAGTLALARHDFGGGLRLGRAALRAAPQLAAPLPVIADAEIELGRYDNAARTLQRLVDWKPSLAAYARVSYFRELHGDIGGAVGAMRLAVSAGGDTAENSAYVNALLGSLELDRGRIGAARVAFAAAAGRFAGYAPAEAGLARVDAARGRLAPAIRRLRRVVARLPLPEYAILLGETELAAGQGAAGRRDLALVGAEQRLLRANGVNTDVDLALYQASHGSPRRAIGLARRAWELAPSVRSADARSWAHTRAGRPVEGLAWARRALRLGSKDPSYLLHAGLAATAAGERGLGRRWLREALAHGLSASPYWAPRARRALR